MRSYQIFRIERERLRFVEDANDLETAQTRMEQWETIVPGDYLLFEFATNGSRQETSRARDYKSERGA
jgi:hypothetical protein